MPNLLDAPLISTPAGRHSLPGLLAALARGKVRGFAALRPHQRPAWHMFLVQLAALALWSAGRGDPPGDEADWRGLLLGLTSGDPGPWELAGPEDRPAFLQPPAPKGLKWSPLATPDALDLLITSRNHDLKQQVARNAAPEDWIFALVSLQTSEGYGGAGNQGIARMNGGSSSRAMLGLAPMGAQGGGPDPSAWWRRDVTRLLALRREGGERAPGTAGGPALLWRLDWPEGRQLDLTRLDPWFIEVCRRIRLEPAGEGFTARRSTSVAARIDAKAFRGVTGDPWAPVSTDDPAKALTLSERDFSYDLLSELLFEGKWYRPPMADPAPGDHDCLIVAEALSRGNSKTDGFKSRLIPVPSRAVGLFAAVAAGDIAKEQIAEIKVFDEALRNALALVAARGDYEAVGKAQYARAADARARFDRAADALFFPALWERLAATGAAREAAGEDFVRRLFGAAKVELAAALPAIPCAAIYRPRAEARARRAFFYRVRRGKDGGEHFQHLFQKEGADV